MATPEFQNFFAVLRQGDPQAVRELLRQHEPFLRAMIHLRLIDGRLRRTVDTMDIFQTLLKDFLDLTRERSAHPPPEASADVRAFLAAAIHHKILTRLRKERRNAGSLPDGWQPLSPESPARQAEDQDYQQAIRDRLPEPARRLFELKMQGFTWPEIAAQVGGRADALRMRLRRALAEVLGALGHEEFCDGP